MAIRELRLAQKTSQVKKINNVHEDFYTRIYPRSDLDSVIMHALAFKSERTGLIDIITTSFNILRDMAIVVVHPKFVPMKF